MRRERPTLSENQRMDLAEDYYNAAMEDLGTIEVLYRNGFKHARNACMLMARASEKLMKSKLLQIGKNPEWIHDQAELMLMLGFREDDPLMHTASLFSMFATGANYPSDVRDGITKSSALRCYDELFPLIEAVASIEPIFAIPSKPRRSLWTFFDHS